MARAATSDELTLYRSPGKASILRAAILSPHTIYTARVNQSFATWDQVLEITYDTGSGTLANVLPDMTLLVGSSAGAHDKGITRIRSIDGTKVYVGETSDIAWADNDYLTIIDDFGLWARHVLITSGVPYMDGGITYSDQHSNPDPTPIMGSHRVLKLTGASVSTQFSGAGSYVIGGLSSISTYAWSCATASASSGTTTATATFTFNTTGWHLVYLTLTTAGSKSFFGVRYVYVWSAANPPPSARIDSAHQEADSGGWEFNLTLFDDADLTSVRDHALVILFAEDYFGATNQSIGPLAGSENVIVTGWIAKESILWNPEAGSVRFTGHTAQYWFGRIPSFPDGLELTTGTPAAWTEFQSLTVDKGLWHMLHWRTTATRVMDVFLTGDTKYTAEVSSLASNLWEQIREMGFLQIYARAGCNAHNQLFVEVYPQLVPAASRTWPTVMTITKPDWQGEISFDRITIPECAVVSLSGVAVNESGAGSSYFSLSPGHTYPHYGSIDVQDKLLVAGQAQANQLAGLYRGWRNNPYPDIPIALAADIRLIDCFPRSKCAITITDTPRGITYAGNLLPTAVSIVTDPETGYLHREVTFEAETGEDISINGDIPGGREDVSLPPTPALPRLPAFPTLIPGTVEPSVNGPSIVVIHDANNGLLYTTTFGTSPSWIFFNAGLTTAQKQAINFFYRTPSGACYCGAYGNSGGENDGYFLARATSLGGTWTVLYDTVNLYAPGERWGIQGVNINPNAPDTIGVVLYNGDDPSPRFYIGVGGVFTAGAYVSADHYYLPFNVTYGLNKWMCSSYGNQGNGKVRLISANGLSLLTTGLGNAGFNPAHARASTTGITFHERVGNGMFVGADNMSSYIEYTDTRIKLSYDTGQNTCFDVDPTGQYMMTNWDSAGKGRSSDWGATFGTIPNLALYTQYYYAYAGGVGLSSRWVAAGGGMIWYSANFGDTWTDRRGNLTGFIPLPAINLVKVLSY